MSTFSQNVQKVKDAFEKIKTALTGKGVAVPSDAKLSDVPALVDGISTGTPALCTFELTYTDGTRTVETTSEGVVSLVYRCYSRTQVKSVSLTFNSSAVFATDATSMFYSCFSLASLTLPSGFGASVTSAISMFSDCRSLTSLTLPEGFGASITDATSMFFNCFALASITLPEGFGAKITRANYMFYFCEKLPSLTLPSGFGASVTSAISMFSDCRSLTQILAPEGVTLADDGSNGILRMKTSFDLSPTALDKESLIRVIKSLQTVTSATLTLGTALKAKLEGDDNADGAAALALAASKGWTIA